MSFASDFKLDAIAKAREAYLKGEKNKPKDEGGDSEPVLERTLADDVGNFRNSKKRKGKGKDKEMEFSI